MRLQKILPPLLAAAASMLLQAAAAPRATAPGAREVVQIGIIDNFNYDASQDTVKATVATLGKKLPEYEFRTRQLNSIDPVKAFRDEPVDFLITSSGTFFELAVPGLVSHVATRKTVYADDPSASEGASLVVLAKRGDILELGDLAGKKAIASQPNSLEGWLSALYEIKAAGHDPERFFSEVSFSHFLFPDAFSYLSSGGADVAVLSTCLLERLDREGVIDISDYRVVNRKTGDSLKCAHSTALYPGVVFASRDDIPPALAWKVTQVLLTMPEQKGYGWTIAKRFSHVSDLYRELAMGPYAHLRDWTPSGIWRRWGTQISVALAAIAFLILNSLYLRVLVLRRTRQLRHALVTQARLEKEARKNRQRLSELERLGVISMMSGMLAHELQQPLLAINNYLSGLRIHLGKKGLDDNISRKSLDHIEFNSGRIAEIVQRVRGYAKSKRGVMTPCDLVEIARRALAVLRDGQYRTVPTEFKCALKKAPVMGQALELELVVINLMRNACSAALDGASPRIWLTLTEDGPAHWLVEVRDNGPALDDAHFERLTSLGDSVKQDGLGIGLSLVRGIVESHGADLRFRRLPTRGISAEFRMEKLEEENG